MRDKEAESLNTVDLAVGRLIEARRDEIGLSLAQVADQLGIEIDQLRQFETGKRRPSPLQLLGLCAVLHSEPSTFLQVASPSYIEHKTCRDRTGNCEPSSPRLSAAPRPRRRDRSSLDGAIEIRLPNEFDLRVDAEFNETALRRVLAVLGYA